MGERPLHTGEAVGSIPIAPTRYINDLAQYAFTRAHDLPTKLFGGVLLFEVLNPPYQSSDLLFCGFKFDP